MSPRAHHRRVAGADCTDMTYSLLIDVLHGTGGRIRTLEGVMTGNAPC